MAKRDLEDTLLQLVRDWPNAAPDEPAHKMINRLEIPGLWVDGEMSPGRLVDEIMAAADRQGVLRRMKEAVPEQVEEDPEVILEEVLIVNLT